MRELNPTLVAVFVYLQPLFATIFAIGLGKDELNWVKLSAAILIFAGVYLVTAKKKEQTQKI
jgi:drug/metabolite transporter (DMT)-like permease